MGFSDAIRARLVALFAADDIDDEVVIKDVMAGVLEGKERCRVRLWRTVVLPPNPDVEESRPGVSQGSQTITTRCDLAELLGGDEDALDEVALAIYRAVTIR